MSDRPILFSGPMVRALLAGTKSQTRRMPAAGITLDPMVGGRWNLNDGHYGLLGASDQEVKDWLIGRARFKVGDRLYVREAWRTWEGYDSVAPSKLQPPVGLWWEADAGNVVAGKLRQGMHMPRWASRLALEVVEVKAEPLQDISEADAIAEGIHRVNSPISPPSWAESYESAWYGSPVVAYRTLWDRLNADRGFGWDTNPWVIAVSFTVHHGNIDAGGSA